MYGHSAIVRRIPIFAVALLAAGSLACGRVPAGSAGSADAASVAPNAHLTEFEYAGQHAAPVIVPAQTSTESAGRTVFDPFGPTLVP